jgi:alpha-tubulin suppressor-like RCC1 family protein
VVGGEGTNGRLGNGDGAGNDASSATRAGTLTGAVELAHGSSMSCARLASGQVWCWGYNPDGQVGTGTTATPVLSPTAVVTISDATSIAAATGFTCAVRASGGVWCWGNNDYGRLGVGTTTPALFTAPQRIPGIP